MARRNDSGTSFKEGLSSSFLCLFGTKLWKSLIGVTIGNKSSLVSSGVNDVPKTLSGPMYVDGAGRFIMKSRGNKFVSSKGIKILSASDE